MNQQDIHGEKNITDAQSDDDFFEDFDDEFDEDFEEETKEELDDLEGEREIDYSYLEQRALELRAANQTRDS